MSQSFVLIVMITILFEWSECESDLRYFLYVGGDDIWSELPCNGIIDDPLWCPDKNVKVLIHGYNSNETAVDFDILNSHLMTILAQEYDAYDTTLNVVAVDWRELATASRLKYFSIVKNVKPVGAMIANYLVQLLENGAIKDLESIHILGLSMGAHVAGAVGYEIQKIMKGKKVARITGLDPAGPGFTTWNGRWPDDLSIVLDYSDAEFVDIIHTNMGRAILEPILSGALGTDLQTGHIDFYPNGGEVQRYQCSFWEDRFDTCSHNMCVLFYAQALRNPYTYTGCPCDNYELFFIGRCPCTYNETGTLLGDLTRHSMRARYYMTIREFLSRQIFEEESSHASDKQTHILRKVNK